MADPTILGSYAIDSVIYRGRHATSYLATHAVMRSQRVVLRVLSPEATADSEFVEQFETQARTSARLHHDAIAGVLDLQRDGDQIFLVLEFIEGLDVGTLLSNFGAMPAAVAAAIVRDVLRGLEHTHAAGVTHGQLRPRRIKVNPEGGVKILGFGVRENEAPAGTAPSAEEQLEVAYRAPEQGEREAEVTPAMDLFACGALLYQMLSGRLPYGETGAAASDARPVPLGDVNPLVGAPLVELVEHLLERRPEARPASAQDARLRLEDVLESMRVSVGADLVRDYLASPRAAAESARQHALGAMMRVARDLADGPPPDPQAATRVLQRVLQVDPVNEVARAFMQELEGGSDKTMVMMSPFTPDKPAAAPAPPAAAPPPVAAPPPPPAVAPPPAPRPEAKAAPKSAPPAEAASPPPPKVAPAPPPPAAKPARPAASAPAQKPTGSQQAPAGFARHKGLLIGLGAVIVVGIVALVVVLTRQGGEVAVEAPAAPAGATLDIATQPIGAIVQVKTAEGSRTGTSNTMFEGLPPGTWPVHVELAGYLPRDTSVTLSAGATQALEVVLLSDAAAKTCSLYVTVQPRADLVLVNGKPASGKETLFWTSLDAGRYKVEASARGFLTTSDRGKAGVGEVKRLSLMLNAAPVAPVAPAPGTVAPAAPAPVAVSEPANGVIQQVRVSPKCDIWVDGQLRASGASSLDVKLAPGRHEVQFKHPDFALMRRNINIKAGKSAGLLQVDLARGEGGISVRAPRSALRIFVDDKSTGQTTPGVVRGLKPGRHKVDIREKDGVTVVASQSVIIEDASGNQVVQF